MVHQKNILVTGASGFIGFHLADALQREGHRLTLIDNFARNEADAAFEELLSRDGVRFIQADMTGTGFRKELDGRYDEVYHLAAINGTRYFYEMPYEVLRVNILALMNLLEWIKPENTGRFLFTSSSEAYAGTITEFGSCRDFIPTAENVPLCISDPYNERFSYAGSKLAGELMVINRFRKTPVPFTIIRYHNIYGPRMGNEHVIPEFARRIIDCKDPFEVFGGEDTRAFCYITDAVDGTIRAMRRGAGPGTEAAGTEASGTEAAGTETSGTEAAGTEASGAESAGAVPAGAEPAGNTFHIGNDTEEIRITDLARKMLDLTGSDATMKIHPSPEGSVKRRCPDIRKIKKRTGYEPRVTLDEGLKRTIEWYRKAIESVS